MRLDVLAVGVGVDAEGEREYRTTIRLFFEVDRQP
jgi:hypothetical protein